MSSMYLFQKRGGEGKEVRALDSTSSLTRSTTTAMDLVEGVMEGKKVALRQTSSKVVISSVVSEVCPDLEVSSRRHCWAALMAKFVGTLVKRETTSKKIRVSSSLRVCEDMNVANL